MVHKQIHILAKLQVAVSNLEQVLNNLEQVHSNGDQVDRQMFKNL